MERIYGAYYPDDDLGPRKLPDNTDYLAEHRIFRPHSEAAAELGRRFRARLEGGETLYLLGLLGTSHNSGVALLEASRAGGIKLLVNCEEERFCGVKHYAGYPRHSVAEIKRYLARRGIAPAGIFGVFYAFDVVAEERLGLGMLLTNGKIVKSYHFKSYTDTVKPSIAMGDAELRRARTNMFSHSPAVVSVYNKLVEELGLPAETPCVQMLHHESHAHIAYAGSPFARGARAQKPTMIAVLDGGGDLSSVSLFKAQDGRIELLRRNTRANSLEMFYLLCAMVLGGWTALNSDADPRSDNRFMATASLGNQDRLTNPYYRRLRQYFHFGPQGSFFANAVMADDSMAGLEQVVGPFYFVDGDRDSVPTVEQARDLPAPCDRTDIAAAVQLVFEDALFHVVGAMIEETGADQLVLCGQASMNCAANMRLMEHFGPDYYRHYGLAGERLQLWVPPFPCDQGAIAGAAYQFAMQNGARPAEAPIAAALCGDAPGAEEIADALEGPHRIAHLSLGAARDRLADFMAELIGKNAVIGLFHGPAENGARALGHRSLFVSPRHPDAHDVVNARIKRREPFRPLCPMLTLEAARELFELEAGARAEDYDAYGYMLITARAKPAAREALPAAVHSDGLSRIQILGRNADPLLRDLLAALERRTGVAACLNTSLNVGTPIVQTPAQAVALFDRVEDVDALFLVARTGEATMVWPQPRAGTIDVEAAWKGRAQDRVPTRRAYGDERSVLEALLAGEIGNAEARRLIEDMRAAARERVSA